jgi:hypothetical protein
MFARVVVQKLMLERPGVQRILELMALASDSQL